MILGRVRVLIWQAAQSGEPRVGQKSSIVWVLDAGCWMLSWDTRNLRSWEMERRETCPIGKPKQREPPVHRKKYRPGVTSPNYLKSWAESWKLSPETKRKSSDHRWWRKEEAWFFQASWILDSRSVGHKWSGCSYLRWVCSFPSSEARDSQW